MKHPWWLFSAAAGCIAGLKLGSTVSKEKLEERGAQSSNKYWQSYLMMDQWVRIKQEGKSLAAYFQKNGYQCIAIYGMNYSGITLLDELSGSGIEVKYGIDANADHIYSDIPVYKLSDELDPVDAVVVSPIYYFDEIERNVSEKMDCPIIPLDDVVFYT